MVFPRKKHKEAKREAKVDVRRLKERSIVLRQLNKWLRGE